MMAPKRSRAPGLQPEALSRWTPAVSTRCSWLALRASLSSSRSETDGRQVVPAMAFTIASGYTLLPGNVVEPMHDPVHRHGTLHPGLHLHLRQTALSWPLPTNVLGDGAGLGGHGLLADKRTDLGVGLFRSLEILDQLQLLRIVTPLRVAHESAFGVFDTRGDT